MNNIITVDNINMEEARELLKEEYSTTPWAKEFIETVDKMNITNAKLTLENPEDQEDIIEWDLSGTINNKPFRIHSRWDEEDEECKDIIYCDGEEEELLKDLMTSGDFFTSLIDFIQ